MERSFLKVASIQVATIQDRYRAKLDIGGAVFWLCRFDLRADPTRENSLGLFDDISPTRRYTWLSRPLKFKLRYVDGIKEPTAASVFLGKRVHDGLAIRRLLSALDGCFAGLGTDTTPRYSAIRRDNSLRNNALRQVCVKVEKHAVESTTTSKSIFR